MNLFRSRSNVIAYTIDKAAYGDLYISVENGEVTVKAPWYLTRNEIQEIVEEKKKWIIKKLEEYEKTTSKNSKKKEFVKSRIVKIFGQNYELKIKYENIKIPELNLEKDEIQISLPNKYKKVGNTEILKLLIQKMYEKIAEEEIEKIMEKTRIKLGFAPEDYEIRNIGKELARCEKGQNIIINPEIVKLDKKAIEFIIMHEFCHLKYKTHSKGFTKIMEENILNYDKQLEKLKEYQY